MDGLHPAQLVVDTLCGDNKGHYAKELETWYGIYMDSRGLKNKMFKPVASCVEYLVVLLVLFENA